MVNSAAAGQVLRRSEGRSTGAAVVNQRLRGKEFKQTSSKHPGLVTYSCIVLVMKMS